MNQVSGAKKAKTHCFANILAIPSLALTRRDEQVCNRVSLPCWHFKLDQENCMERLQGNANWNFPQHVLSKCYLWLKLFQDILTRRSKAECLTECKDVFAGGGTVCFSIH